MSVIDANSGEVMLVETARVQFADRINAAWNQTLQGILDAGRLLCEAKVEIPHGSFEEMIERDLRFGPRTARMLMAIHRSERLRKHASVLPTSWFTLYSLTTLNDEAFQIGIEHNLIRSDMERKDLNAIKTLMREAERASSPSLEDGCTVEELNDLIAAGRKYSVIYADPPWTFEVYSGKGKTRSAERHYDTMSLDAIKALPVAQLAEDNCALLLWAVMPQLPEALEVIATWGFEYKTAGFVWVKQVSLENRNLAWGMGYWTRANAEMCLLATKGSPKRQATDVHQIIMSPVGEHSRKPEETAARIERLLEGPYLELFGRKAVPGWTVWGNQVTRNLFHQGIPEFAA
jgi:N6-adenosine-specific RNA methylase IME4